MSRRLRRSTTALGVLALALLYAAVELPQQRAPEPRGEPGAADAIDSLWDERRSGAIVEASGLVSKLLPDDLEGARHQRFIVRLGTGRTVLVSHNIDLAPRVDALREGDTIVFRGQYEWNPRGGVVHWTHHDPGGRRPGGWLEHRGRTYR